jgi:pyruvate dehydrogenase E2 component (dihydrolipoamide acetyltransferase)
MAELFKMPMLGQSMEEGTILQWFKNEGESVRKGEILLEIMSDKANIEVESPVEGVVRKLLCPSDATVPVHTPIAIIGSVDESIDALLSDSMNNAVNEDKSISAVSNNIMPDQNMAGTSAQPQTEIYISPRASRRANEAGVSLSELQGLGTGPQGRILERDVEQYLKDRSSAERVRATPLASRMAKDLGVDIEKLASETAGGRIRSGDVLGAASVKEAPSADISQDMAAALKVDSVIPYHRMKKISGETVAKSRSTAPHVTIVMEVDMTEASDMLKRLRPEVQDMYNTKLTFTDILIKASAKALESSPLCNAALVGDQIQLYANKNIGVATATEDGLLVPVIRSADTKTLGQISVELKSLAERCRTGKQTMDDISDGTFTITNLGAFGVDVFDPIIVPPQSCILGVCRIAEKPVAVHGEVKIRPMMNLCLSFDHRVMDGVPAARFLQRLKDLLESPISLLV